MDERINGSAWRAPVAVLLAIFLVNDIGLYLAPSAFEWLLVDYVSKVMALAVLFAAPVLRGSIAGLFGSLRRENEDVVTAWVRTGILVVLALAVLVALEEFLMPVLREILPTDRLVKFPEIDSVPLYWVDMTFGLALTAVSEELIFRGVLRRALAGAIPGIVSMVIVS